MKNDCDKYIENYNYKKGVMGYATSYCTDIFLRYMEGESVLELGPAEGVMTELLYPHFKDYTIVEGSEYFAQILKNNFPAVKVNKCMFEEYKPRRKFDNIILGHVLEHVEYPVEILKLCKQWLTEDGVILSAVPNAHSLHRQAAVEMGILETEGQLNQTDLGVGHKRVYTIEELKRDFCDAGLTIDTLGGYWLKPLANKQIESAWTEEMIQAFMKLGERYPDIAGEIYIIAKNGE